MPVPSDSKLDMRAQGKAARCNINTPTASHTRMHTCRSEQYQIKGTHPPFASIDTSAIDRDKACGGLEWKELTAALTLEQRLALFELGRGSQLGQEPLLDAVRLLRLLPHQVLQQQAVLDADLPPPVCVRRHLRRNDATGVEQGTI